MEIQHVALIAALVGVWYFLFRWGKASPAEAHRLVDAGARLVDVRTPGEFGGGHLPGAVNIPLDQVSARAAELKEAGRPVVLYCASGARSGQAKRILVGAGLADVHDLGGMGRW